MPSMSPDTVPYPPGPDPEHLSLRLTKPPASLVRSEALLLAGNLLFIVLYCFATLLALAAILGQVWLIQDASPGAAIPLGLGTIVALIAFVSLMKGFFRRGPEPVPELGCEVTEEDQPGLFAFLQRVADDAGCERPDRVRLAYDAHAAVVPHITLANIFTTPDYDLVLGLGLVNALDLDEFQAVIAHEFGHFAESGTIAGTSRLVEGLIDNLLTGHDQIDAALQRLRDNGYGKFVAVLCVIPNACIGVLSLLHQALSLAKSQVLRERELFADRIAASVAGSRAAIRAIRRAQFGAESLARAVADLHRAAEEHHYSADLFFHQHAAAEHLHGNFDDEGSRHYPGNRERIAQLKDLDVPAPEDSRTPWRLVQNAAALRREVTATLLRTWPDVPDGATLSDPRTVQRWLETERAVVKFDPKYGGAYDDRPLKLTAEDLRDVADLVRREPWEEDRIRRVRDSLYDGLAERSRKRAAVAAERVRFLERAPVSTWHRMKDDLADYDDRLERLDDGFHSFDRRVLLVHLHMAAHTRNTTPRDLMEAYRLHLAVQDLQTLAQRHAELVQFHARLLPLDDPRLDSQQFRDFVAILRSARGKLVSILETAQRLEVTDLQLLDEKVIDDLTAGPLKAKWIAKLQRQLERVAGRAKRYNAKTLAAILEQQDELVEAFERVHSEELAAVS